MWRASSTRGAVDYMGREFRRTGLTARRLERVMAFAHAFHGRAAAPAASPVPAEPEPHRRNRMPGATAGQAS